MGLSQMAAQCSSTRIGDKLGCVYQGLPSKIASTAGACKSPNEPVDFTDVVMTWARDLAFTSNEICASNLDALRLITLACR